MIFFPVSMVIHIALLIHITWMGNKRCYLRQRRGNFDFSIHFRGREVGDGGRGGCVAAADNSIERNDTMLSDASSYFPAAQIRRSESNVTSLEGGLNNNQVGSAKYS